jgi:hypothetical protein
MNKDRSRIDFRDGLSSGRGKAIKLMAPTASSVSIGSDSGRCGVGLIRRTNRMIAQAWSSSISFLHRR